MIGPQEQLEGSLIIIGLKKTYRFFHSKFVHFEKSVLERVLSYYTWYSENCSDCQMAFQTDQLLKSNWTVGERLLASAQSQFDSAG